MKAEIKPIEGFKPITLKIAIETQDELNTLYALACTLSGPAHAALQERHKIHTGSVAIAEVTGRIHEALRPYQSID